MLARSNVGTIWSISAMIPVTFQSLKKFRQYIRHIWKICFALCRFNNRCQQMYAGKWNQPYRNRRCLYIKQDIFVSEISYFLKPTFANLFQRVPFENQNFRRQNFWFYPTVSWRIFLHEVILYMYVFVAPQVYLRYTGIPGSDKNTYFYKITPCRKIRQETVG